jgi:hypothetical protein
MSTASRNKQHAAGDLERRHADAQQAQQPVAYQREHDEDPAEIATDFQAIASGSRARRRA